MKYQAECEDCGISCQIETKQKCKYSIKCLCPEPRKWIKLTEVKNE